MEMVMLKDTEVMVHRGKVILLKINKVFLFIGNSFQSGSFLKYFFVVLLNYDRSCMLVVNFSIIKVIAEIHFNFFHTSIF